MVTVAEVPIISLGLVLCPRKIPAMTLPAISRCRSVRGPSCFSLSFSFAAISWIEAFGKRQYSKQWVSLANLSSQISHNRHPCPRRSHFACPASARTRLVPTHPEAFLRRTTECSGGGHTDAPSHPAPWERGLRGLAPRGHLGTNAPT